MHILLEKIVEQTDGMKVFLTSKNIKSIFEVLFVATGFLSGMMFFLLQQDAVKTVISSYLKQCMLTICYTEINQLSYMWEVIRVRSMEFILIFLLLLQKRKKLGILCIGWSAAFFVTVFFAMLIFTYGWKGTVIAFLLMFPQDIVYCSLIYFAVYKTGNNGKNYWYKKDRYTTLCNAANGLLTIFGIILYLALGILLEGYFHMNIMKKILPLLVT